MNGPKSEATERVEDMANQAVREGEETLRQVSERMREYGEIAKQKTKEAREASEVYIRDNPWQSVLGALAVGLVIGALIGFNSRR